MNESVRLFETIARRAHRFTDERAESAVDLHPFDSRDIHPGVPSAVRKLFDDGHYVQATFEAFKFVEKEIQRHSGISETGFKLMTKALSESSPELQLNPLSNQSEHNEQKGFKLMFAGSVLAIRNPRGHEVSISESPDQCLDHLSLASMLLRRLERAGFGCE